MKDGILRRFRRILPLGGTMPFMFVASSSGIATGKKDTAVSHAKAFCATVLSVKGRLLSATDFMSVDLDANDIGSADMLFVVLLHADEQRVVVQDENASCLASLVSEVTGLKVKFMLHHGSVGYSFD